MVRIALHWKRVGFCCFLIACGMIGVSIKRCSHTNTHTFGRFWKFWANNAPYTRPVVISRTVFRVFALRSLTLYVSALFIFAIVFVITSSWWQPENTHNYRSQYGSHALSATLKVKSVWLATPSGNTLIQMVDTLVWCHICCHCKKWLDTQLNGSTQMMPANYHKRRTARETSKLSIKLICVHVKCCAVDGAST